VCRQRGKAFFYSLAGAHQLLDQATRLGYRESNDEDGWLIKSDTPERGKYADSQYKSTIAAVPWNSTARK